MHTDASCSPASQTLWIVGTSASIGKRRYAGLLADAAPRIRVRNISVGDQTSMMGLLRVLTHRSEFRAGDTVIWEYSLLDHLLTLGPFDHRDVSRARRTAWNLLQEMEIGIIAIFTPPLDEVLSRTEAEREAARDAAAIGATIIDLRDLYAELGISDPRAHYQDDRHLYPDSPVHALLVSRLLRGIPSNNAFRERIPIPESSVKAWGWLGVSELASGAGLGIRHLANSLLEVDAVELAIDQQVVLPPTRRIVALGIVSTHMSGGAWCGHRGCPPASTRLPSSENYSFLLRITGLPCLRGGVDAIERVVSAPAWSYCNGCWRDYGQELSASPDQIAIFGALVEIEPREQLSAGSRSLSLLDH